MDNEIQIRYHIGEIEINDVQKTIEFISNIENLCKISKISWDANDGTRQIWRCYTNENENETIFKREDWSQHPIVETDEIKTPNELIQLLAIS